MLYQVQGTQHGFHFNFDHPSTTTITTTTTTTTETIQQQQKRAYDRAVALKRMGDSGAILSTTESSIFDMLKSAEHPKFKEISGLIKQHNANTVNDFASDQFI